MGEGTSNLFKMAQDQLDEVARILNLESGTHTFLREPMKELHVSIPVRMDDGQTTFSVTFNDQPPAFSRGGCRFLPFDNGLYIDQDDHDVTFDPRRKITGPWSEKSAVHY